MIYVIERTLGVASGHHHTQAASIRGLAGTRRVVFLTCRDQKVPQTEHDCLPVLASREEMDRSESKALQHDVKSLQDALDKGSSIIVPTTRDYDIRLALLVLNTQGSNRSVYLRLLSAEVLKRLGKGDLIDLARAVESRFICLLTETVDLSFEISKTYGMPATPDLLLPCSFSSATAGAPDVPRSGAFRVGYFGQPRREKGIDLIVPILKELRRRLENETNQGNIEFLFQRPTRIDKLRNIRYLTALRTMSLGSKVRPSGLSLVELPAFVDDKPLGELMRSVDLFLLPYSMPDYAARGSGIVIDAVSLGKPIVFSRGLGMSEVLASGNAEAATTPTEFAEKILTIMHNAADYRTGCELAQGNLKKCFDRARHLLLTC